MSKAQALEVEVVRILREAASRTPWTLIPMLPSLFRIGQGLRSMVRDVESARVAIDPGELNSLARKIHALGQVFASPLFRTVLSRIERPNLRLASLAENIYMAAEPSIQNMARFETLCGFGPISETRPAMPAFLRSA